MYFEQFPYVYHGYNDEKGQEILVLLRDITCNVRVRREVLANITLYDWYDLKAGETPEYVAEKIYGNASLHWVVMLLNEKYDYLSEFPLSDIDLFDHVTRKYGKGNEYLTHHFINSAGYIVPGTQPGATSLSNFDYENQLNEKKRRIKLIAPSLMPTLLANFDAIMAV